MAVHDDIVYVADRKNNTIRKAGSEGSEPSKRSPARADIKSIKPAAQHSNAP
jgi:hypothetical protein